VSPIDLFDPIVQIAKNTREMVVIAPTTSHGAQNFADVFVALFQVGTVCRQVTVDQ
jgi:hypothetical protein